MAVAYDPDDADRVYGESDMIAVSFSGNTNEPVAATKADLDAIFSFNESLGALSMSWCLQ